MKKITFFIGFLCIVGNLSASLVKVEFEGVITGSGFEGALPDYVTNGSVIEGYYQYDTNDFSFIDYGDAKEYQFDSLPSSLYVEIKNPNNDNESLIFQTDPTNVSVSIFIENDTIYEGGYIITSENNISNDASLAPIVDFNWRLSNLISGNTSLGLRPVSLDDYSSNVLTIIGKDYQSNEAPDFNIFVEISSVDVVPEPLSLTLFGCGAIGIIKRRKR